MPLDCDAILDGYRHTYPPTLSTAQVAERAELEVMAKQIYRDNWCHVQFFQNGQRVASPVG